jgi:hypothetical protein
LLASHPLTTFHPVIANNSQRHHGGSSEARSTQ